MAETSLAEFTEILRYKKKCVSTEFKTVKWKKRYQADNQLHNWQTGNKGRKDKYRS